MPRAAKAKLVEGDFAVAPLYEDCIRIDVIGEFQGKPGWGTARLTIEQAKKLAVALGAAVAAASPRGRKKR